MKLGQRQKQVQSKHVSDLKCQNSKVDATSTLEFAQNKNKRDNSAASENDASIMLTSNVTEY